jgi:hypothetical protein
MGDELWDLEEFNVEEQRTLSQNERKFLMSGEPGSPTKAKMERRVANKAGKLPERIQQLIDDVSLLYFDGYVGNVENDDLWRQSLRISNRSQLVRDTPILRTREARGGPEQEFGFQIGTLIRMVRGEGVPPDLIWGLIIGLVGEPRGEEHYHREATNLVHLFDELNGRLDWRLVTAGTLTHEGGEGFETEREEILDILQQADLAPAPPLIDQIIGEYSTQDSELSSGETRELWEADPAQTDHPDPPEDAFTPEEIRQASLRRIVHRLLEQTQLRGIDRLAKDLRQDAFGIQNWKSSGIDAEQTFRTIAENENETHVGELSQTSAKGQNNMTHMLRVLASPDSTWVNRPALAESREDNNYWTVTDYGGLLYETRFRRNCSTNWLYELIGGSQSIGEHLKKCISKLV